MFQNLVRKSILKRIHRYISIDGWLSDREAFGLYFIAKKLPVNSVIVEIGSWQGKSTYCISKGLKSGKVYAIDPFNAEGGCDTASEKEYVERKGAKDLLEIFKKNMEDRGVLDKIIIKKGYSDQYYNDFDKIDFLFIDGDHSIEGCKSDFNLYAPKIVPGGFIAFHDFYEQRDELGPTYVIKNLILKSNDFKFYQLYDSLWVARKK
jgi:predicted O-methyltransferase YrrM